MCIAGAGGKGSRERRVVRKRGRYVGAAREDSCLSFGFVRFTYTLKYPHESVNKMRCCFREDACLKFGLTRFLPPWATALITSSPYTFCPVQFSSVQLEFLRSLYSKFKWRVEGGGWRVLWFTGSLFVFLRLRLSGAQVRHFGW